ncbi:MAG: hypothetical protein J0M17_17825 [Planctomycetes bacterium]|nr:hypothetical protein [Planctomycetota bacterium]
MSKKKKPSSLSLTSRVDLRISSAEKKLFQEAANRQGIGLSQWLRLAAHKVVNDHHGKVELINLDR